MNVFSRDSYQLLVDRLLNESSQQELCPDLSRVHVLSKLLDHPEKSYPTIHIAGSNGKGSVATKIAAGLELGGYKTGLYTSPHLFSVQERMQINKEMISQEILFSMLSSLYDLIDKNKLQLTFFDIMTFLAFSWFSQQKVDVAVIETGLGGELDATNVIVPVLSVITSISLEHTDRLGPTKEIIAQAKAGIIKPSVPVVVGPQARYSSIQKKAQLCGSPLIIAEESKGWYDIQNSLIARRSLETVRSIFPKIPEDITSALDKRPPCRFFWYKGALLDVAHNLDGFYQLFQAIEQKMSVSTKKIRMIVGLSKDKDLEKCLRFLAKKVSFLHLVQANTLKAAPVQTLAAILSSFSDPPKFSLETSVTEAVVQGKFMADQEGELLVITGSFYLMKEALEGLAKLAELENK